VSGYRPDARTLAELRAAVARMAAATPVPHADRTAEGAVATWDDALAADPLTAALVESLVGRHTGLLDHLAAVPDAVAAHLLETVSGIGRLPAQPSLVIVAAQPEPGLVPAVVPALTPLAGPKDGVVPSRYLTTDTLNVTGATLVSVGGYQIDADGDRAATWADRAVPFALAAGPIPAPHELYVVSGQLGFVGGDLTAEVIFTGGADVAALLGLEWWYRTPEGDTTATATRASATTLRLAMSGGLVPAPLAGADRTFVRAAMPPGLWSPLVVDYTFTGIEVRVQQRAGLQPDAAFYNDGLVDISKEFKPFGDVPRRGDSFYLRSDEAFGKDLESVTVTLEPLDADEWGYFLAALFRVSRDPVMSGTVRAAPEPDQTISWERYDGADWVDAVDSHELKTTTVSLDSVAGPTSRPATIGGQTGRFVRAFLRQGDFGWEDHLTDIAEFAARAAAGGDPSADLLVAPKPPQLRRVRLSYTTPARPAEAVYARSGLAFGAVASGRVRPFADPLQTGARPSAAVYVGLDVASEVLGTTMSLHFDIDASVSCRPAADAPGPGAAWQAWTGVAWTNLAVADGTGALRASGLLRFVTPADWAVGCPETDSPTGRWLRLLTTAPALVGAIEAVVPDAVEATYQPLATMAPPEAGAVKGPSARLVGVKRLTNPVRGRPHTPEESDDDYLRRAPQILRHRNRPIQPGDYEMLVRSEFPEVGFVACLPHHAVDDAISPGSVGLVVIPDDPAPAPLPGGDLALRIETALMARAPVHARISVLCPVYTEISVVASIVLMPGIAAVDARATISAAVDDALHPRGRAARYLGRALYTSTLVRLLEGLPQVDRVTALRIEGLGPDALRVEPADPCRGLVVSSGRHHLDLTEQLR
jgi:hypothetical protein